MPKLIRIILFYSLLLATVSSALFFTNLIVAKERVPFDDIRWKHGYPEVIRNGSWVELLAVNGVGIQQLVENAIEEWGPSYQDKFIAGFCFLLEKKTGSSGPICTLRIRDGKTEESFWRWSTRSRYRSCLASLKRRRAMSSKLSTGKLTASIYDQHNSNNQSSIETSRLTRKELIEDLQYFEWTLLNRFSYLNKPGCNYKTKLDSLTKGINSITTLKSFAIGIEKILRSFNDHHTSVSYAASRLAFGKGKIPIDVIVTGDKLACLKPGRGEYINPDYPFLKSINGIDLNTLAKKTTSDKTVTRGRTDCFIPYSQKELLDWAVWEKPSNKYVLLNLESRDGSRTKKVTIPMAEAEPETQKASVFPVESQILRGGIGYLGLRRRLFPGQKFKTEIVNAMLGLKQTKALILDLRGNAGGKRDVIPLLFQYFTSPLDRPAIINIAAVRMNKSERPSPNCELLRNRMLWSADWNGWNADEKQLIKKMLEQFTTSFKLHDEEFSSLHFMIVPRETEQDVYHYNKKVIVLQDGESGSATGVLLSALKGKGNMVLMGTPSNSDSGFPQAYQLPNSGIVYWLSSMASFLPDGTLLNKIEPDIFHNLRFQDLNNHLENDEDPLLEQAIMVLKK